jgi:hypothetical protein
MHDYGGNGPERRSKRGGTSPLGCGRATLVAGSQLPAAGTQLPVRDCQCLNEDWRAFFWSAQGLGGTID